MATPISNDIVSNQASEGTEPEVHVMPERFLSTKTAVVKKNRLGTWLLVTLVSLAVIGVGVALFFLLVKAPTSPVTETPVVQPATTTPVVGGNLSQKGPADRDRERLETMRQLQLALQRYFLQTTTYPRSLDLLVPNFISEVPIDPLTSQPYLYTGGEGVFQISFTLEEGTAWGVSVLPKGKYLANATAIIPETEQTVVSPTTTPSVMPPGQAEEVIVNNPVPPTIGVDTDADGLTDIEETIYQTASSTPDTDGDGYKDGEEIMAAYDPASKTKRIWQSSSTAVYRNQTYRYSVIYPKVWATRSVDDDKEIFLTDIATNEFFNILVQDNPLGLSAINWYLRQNPNINPNLLTTLTVGGVPAIQTADGLVTYVSSGTKLFVISYNVGIDHPANFFATYKMLLTTWQFTNSVSVNPPTTNPALNNQNNTSTPQS